MSTHVLYSAPHVCSLVPHIALRELAIPFELVRVDLRTHATASGEPLADVTRKDYVPALRLPDGEVLTETAVILLYLADLHPEAQLAPRDGFARVRFHELLHFLATELHKAFSVFTIMDSPSDASRAWATARLGRRVAVLDELLGERVYLGGDAPSMADFYAYWALSNYARLTRVELPARLRGLVERIGARPAVIAARAADR